MKKFRRVLALLTVFAMAVSIFTTAGVFAADDEMGNPEFLFGEVKAELASVKGGLYKSNTAVSFDGELFDKGFVAVQGDKGGAWDNDYMKFSLDTSTIFGSDYTAKTNDILYLSFYYKIPTTYSYNSTEYTSAAAKGVEINAGANKNGGQRMFDLTAVDTGNKRLSSKPITKADGEWHKAQLGFFAGANTSETVMKNIAKDGKTNFSFNFYPDNSSGPFKMLIADEFTVGLMRFDSTKYTSETASTYTTYIRGLDYLCRTLEATKPDIKAISADGYITKTENEFVDGIDTGIKKTEYTVTVSSDNPTIKMSNDEGGSFKKAFSADVTKEGDWNIVKACAPTYDKTGAESVNYVKFEDLTCTEDPGKGGGVVKAFYADAVNPAEYSETFTFNYDTDYKVFDPNKAGHSVGKKEAKNAIVKFTGDTVEKQDITDDTFTQAYVMELIKNSEYTGSPLTTGTDDNFFQFEYNVGDYGKKGDIMAFSFYIKNESETGTNVGNRIVVTGDPTTETGTRCVVSDKNWTALEHISGDNIAPDGGWKRLIYLSNINANGDGSIPTTQWLRVSIEADGSQDNKIFIAEPKCTVMRRPEYYYPEIAFRTNNDRLTVAGKNFVSKTAGISAVTVYENTVEVPAGQTSVTVKGREANINKIKPVSKHGDIPYIINAKGNGVYEITPVAIGYNKVGTALSSGNRLSYYCYNGVETTERTYDYERALTEQPVTLKSNYIGNSRVDIANSAMTGLPLTLITELDENVSVTFKKDGAAVSAGNYASEPDGSAYSLTVSGNYFLSVYKLMLAAYTEDGALVATSPAVGFRKNAATATISGLKNDGTLKFKAFVWEGLMPITQAAEITANAVGIPVIIR